ncbi:hypothetical protein ABPG72_014698 [Tetrahymena utriculariae]
MVRHQKTAKVAAPEGNQKNLDFTLQRLGVYKEQIEYYKTQQQQIKQEDLKLLGFKNQEKDKNSGDDDDEENSSNKQQQLLRRVNQIKQQIELIKKVGTQVEKDLNLNEDENKKKGISEEQVKEAQLKTITEEQAKYQNLVFNMDYQLDLNQASNTRRYRRETEYDPEKWFELSQSDQKTQVSIYSYSKASFDTWIQNFVGKNEYDHLNLYIHRIETEADFYAFDDFVQTIKLTNNSFQTVCIDVQFDNNLCVLALLRFLISLDRFNTLNITSCQTRNKYQFEKIGELLESIFTVAFSHRHLQGIRLSIPCEAFQHLINSSSKISIKDSSLQVYSFSTDLKLVDTNKVQDYFKFLQQFPLLTHVIQQVIPVSVTDAIENLNVLLKKVKYANLNLVSIPSQFDFNFYFVNLQHLKLELGLEPNVLTKQKLENLLLSIKESKKLQLLKLNFYTYVAEETSRKEILKQAQTIKNLKNNKNQEQTPETKDETPNENTNGMKFFDHLSELAELEDFNVNLQATQEIFDSLHKLLVRSTNLKKYNVTYKYEKEKNKMDKFIDLKNIYETLNNLKKCSVNIQTPHGNISYALPNKDSTFYNFKLGLNQDLQHVSYTFKQNEFQFDKVKSARITSSNFENLEEFDTLCKSIASCKSLQNLKIIANYSNVKDQHKTIQRQPFNKPNLTFFKQFEVLKNLENVFIECILDQFILNSISEFLEKNKKIKSFILKRQYLLQYYLDYTKLFKNLQQLPELNQVYINLQLEELTVSEVHKQTWENHKQKAFYEPFCEFIKEASQTLQLIDFDQNTISEESIKKILQSVSESKHHHYLRMNPSQSDTLIQSENEEIQELLKACDEKGVLVKSYFKFPLCLPTGTYYDYNQDRW